MRENHSTNRNPAVQGPPPTNVTKYFVDKGGPTADIGGGSMFLREIRARSVPRRRKRDGGIPGTSRRVDPRRNAQRNSIIEISGKTKAPGAKRGKLARPLPIPQGPGLIETRRDDLKMGQLSLEGLQKPGHTGNPSVKRSRLRCSAAECQMGRKLADGMAANGIQYSPKA